MVNGVFDVFFFWGSVAEEMGNMGTVRARKVRACYWVRKLNVDGLLEGLMNKWYISRTA